MHEKLLENIQFAISNTVQTKKFGIAFSGGVDSTLISKICDDMGFDITLLTIGFTDSHDISFSKEVNSKMHLKHEILEIESKSFSKIVSFVREKIKYDNLSWIENSIAFYYISKLAKNLGLDLVVTANGVDELFCGYDAYRKAFLGGEENVIQVMNSKIENELQMMKAVNEISSTLGIKIIQPLLSSKFVKFAKTIPISEKIHDSEDLIRKHAIRELAKMINVPEISYSKRKKAMQYGSRIHKELLKVR